MIYLTVIPACPHRIVTDIIQSTVELMDDKLVVVHVFRADVKQDDEAMPAKNHFHSTKHVFKRQFITGVTLNYYDDVKQWGVEISVIGAGGCEPCFREERMAIAFVDDLLEWSSQLSIYPHVN